MLRRLRYVGYALLALIVLLSICYAWINISVKRYLYDDIQHIPHRTVGLVLGTNKYLRSGVINEYYQTRIEAAVKLYQAGKVSYLIVSGDNRKNNYNEPKQMREDLMARGVPANRIQPDYAGLRTLDSVLRMEKIFGHKDYVLISQRFHNQRALFLAHAKGQHPIAFVADNPPTLNMTRVLVRESFARVKALLDLVVNKQAKHYGTPIQFP